MHIPKLAKYFSWARVGTYLNKTFPVSYMFDSKKQTLRTESQTYFISLRENERQFTKYRFIAIGNAKNLWFSQKLNFEVVVRAICCRDQLRSFDVLVSHNILLCISLLLYCWVHICNWCIETNWASDQLATCLQNWGSWFISFKHLHKVLPSCLPHQTAC